MSWLDDLTGIQLVNGNGALDVSMPLRKRLRLTGDVGVFDDPVADVTDIVIAPEAGGTLVLCSELNDRAGLYDGQPISAGGYLVNADGGQGTFIWKAGSLATVNNGTVFGGAGAGRWHRIVDSSYNVRWFGARGDGVSDDAVAINAALSAVPSGGKLLFPQGVYPASTTLTRASSIHIIGHGATIKRSGSWNGLMLYIHGTSISNKIDFVTVEGLTIDGNDSGVISYTPPFYDIDLGIFYTANAKVVECKFQNTRLESLTFRWCGDVSLLSCRFRNGAPSAAADSANSVYHTTAHFNEKVLVDSNYYTSDIEYLPGVGGTHGSELAMSPFACALYNNDYVVLTNNVSIDAGNFEVYEANREVVVSDNIFLRVHIGAIKLSNCQHYTITGNQVLDSLHEWGANILAGSYTRLNTYGAIRPEQGVGTITGNVIRNNRTREGAIFVLGELYSSTLLNQRIAGQASYGYTTHNIVTLESGEYYYTDFDGVTKYGPISQDYLNVRNTVVAGNTIDGFCINAFKSQYTDNLTITGNMVTNCANHLPPEDWVGHLDTRSAVYAAEFKNLTVTNNSFQMPDGAQPQTTMPDGSIVDVAMNGIIAWTTTTAFRRQSRAMIEHNRFGLTQCNTCVDLQDLGYASVQNNDFRVEKFTSTNGAFIRSRGICERGRIAGNQRTLIDDSVTPTPSTEYSNLQSFFLSLYYDDDRRGVDISKRLVQSISTFTTPLQVVAGYYEAGSTVAQSGQQGRIFYTCTTSGHWAPAYSALSAYSRGNKVKSAGGDFFVALASLVAGTTPPATTTSNASWEYLGSTEAVFERSQVPSVLNASLSNHNPSDLADGAGETATVTVTGAALGDFVDASFSLNLQGITLTAWVSAADEVSVRFQNETGASVNLGNGLLRVRVVKA